MDYLGTENIIHRDLATRNVLISSENRAKISDFGLAQPPNTGNYYTLKTDRHFPFGWFAIECLKEGKFSAKSDVWAYGVTCWEMFTRGGVPYPDWKHGAIVNELQNGKRLPPKPPCTDTIYVTLIWPCLNELPSDRPTFYDLQQTVKNLLDSTPELI